MCFYTPNTEREGTLKRARERESASDRTESEAESLRGREGGREEGRGRKVICLYYERIIEIER